MRCHVTIDHVIELALQRRAEKAITRLPGLTAARLAYLDERLARERAEGERIKIWLDGLDRS